MNKLAFVAAAALTAATFGAGAVLAQQNSGDTSNFDTVDANKDGTVSFTEAQGVYPTLTQELFDQADGNHDGSLDSGEFTSLTGLVGMPGDTGENASSNASGETSSEASGGSSSAQ